MVLPNVQYLGQSNKGLKRSVAEYNSPCPTPSLLLSARAEGWSACWKRLRVLELTPC
uniref:Macaca fascicularis brain cDNA clone: QmoA-11313, similar to human additional sex combs like 2 (Drosophila) (ASXL2), mRNA, RefSeq: NM_018263.2 n=1 Tax=Macaca fascicularis TaxID=9541 RepID=I7G8F5_MACFA|nr:unnamed protein product [Macaca fascicularis]